MYIVNNLKFNTIKNARLYAHKVSFGSLHSIQITEKENEGEEGKVVATYPALFGSGDRAGEPRKSCED